MIPNINEICECCGGNGPQAVLQLFNDKCFKIVEQEKIISDFCLGDFAFLSDGHSCINLNLEPEQELTLFNNQLESLGSPGDELDPDKYYVRGIMLSISYPISDSNGEELKLSAKSVELWIEDGESLQYKRYYLHNLFMMFTNPKTNQADQLINKIKVINPSSDFQIRLKGLLIYGKI
jgi:hypothetical protein